MEKYYGLIHSFPNDRYQRVLLNDHWSNWSKFKAGVPKGSILGPLFFLAYINDLPEGLTTNANLFADDVPLFSVVHDSAASSVSLNNYLLKIFIVITNGKWYSSQVSQNRPKRLQIAIANNNVLTMYQATKQFQLFTLTMFQ